MSVLYTSGGDLMNVLYISKEYDMQHSSRVRRSGDCEPPELVIIFQIFENLLQILKDSHDKGKPAAPEAERRAQTKRILPFLLVSASALTFAPALYSQVITSIRQPFLAWAWSLGVSMVFGVVLTTVCGGCLGSELPHDPVRRAALVGGTTIAILLNVSPLFGGHALGSWSLVWAASEIASVLCICWFASKVRGLFLNFVLGLMAFSSPANSRGGGGS
jgi:hypothetical protein